MRRGELTEVEHPGFHDGLGAAPHTHFAAEVVNMPLHCIDAQNETMGDLSIRGSLQQELQHLAFALRERLDE